MAIELTGVTKDYATPQRRAVHALGELELVIDDRSSVAVMGPSGSGKSTLLQLIGGLDRPTGGTVRVDGADVGRLTGKRLAAHRRSVGFIFQRFNLIDSLTVLENVLMPTVGQPGGARGTRSRALELLNEVGLGTHAPARPGELSGGEQQRVAIARALINQPSVVLADEPTGALDTETGSTIVELLLSLPEQHRTTVVIATHDYSVAARCDRIVTLRDGLLVADHEAEPTEDPATTARRIGALRAFVE
mgnify:CR=1 FL=1